MDPGKVTVITPTIGRDPEIVERCVKSVLGAGINIPVQHLICSDGELEIDVCKRVEKYKTFNSDIRYFFCGPSSGGPRGHYGAGIRQYLLDNADTLHGEFCSFLDDDNVLLPDYFEENIKALRENPDAAFAVSKCIWFHPQARTVQVLKGFPVQNGHIDTIQCFFRTEAIKEHGWILDGYNSDGATYESMAAKYKHVFIDKILSIHF